MPMSFDPTAPIIVQSDKSILVEVNNPRYEEARDELAAFAELEKSPEHIHTYRITPLSLWNAASAGLSAAEIVESLNRLGKYDLPENVRRDIEEYVSRYGRVQLLKGERRDRPALRCREDGGRVGNHGRIAVQHSDSDAVDRRGTPVASGDTGQDRRSPGDAGGV